MEIPSSKKELKNLGNGYLGNGDGQLTYSRNTQ